MIESIRFRPCTAALIALLCMGAVRSVHAQTWTQLPDFPGTARDDAASFTIDARIFVGTGMEVGWGLTNDWYVYDASTEVWASIAPLPATPRQYCSTFVIDGKGYLFGGLDGSGALNELWEYDPSLDLWTERSPLPGLGRYASVGFNTDCFWPIDSAFIATGMVEGGSPTSEFWKYSASTDSWTQLPNIPGIPRHRSCGHSMNCMFDLIGGADSAFNALSEVLRYDPWSGVWDTLPPLPDPRFEARSGPAVVLGGASSLSTINDNVWVLPSGSPAWNDLAPLPFGTRRGGVVGWAMVGFGGMFFYGTGLDNSLVRHSDWWMSWSVSGLSENDGNPLELHPNPGTTSFTLAGLPPDARELIATDAQGRIVQRAALPLNRTVDTRDWSSGSYLITVRDATGRAWRGRWVKL